MLINSTDDEILSPLIPKEKHSNKDNSANNLLQISPDLILSIYSFLKQNDKFHLSSANKDLRKIFTSMDITRNIGKLNKKITYGDLIKLFKKKQTYENIANISCASTPLAFFLALFSESIVALAPIKALGCVPALAIGLGTAGCVGGLTLFGCCATSSHYANKATRVNNKKYRLKREIKNLENNQQIPSMSMSR